MTTMQIVALSLQILITSVLITWGFLRNGISENPQRESRTKVIYDSTKENN